MLELVVALGIIAFIYAYLFHAIEEKHPLRLLFLILCIWNVVILSYIVYKQPAPTIYKYNSSGALIETSIIKYPELPILTTVLEINMWSAIFTVALLTILLLAYILLLAIKKQEKWLTPIP